MSAGWSGGCRETGKRALGWIHREFPVFDPFNGFPGKTPDEASQTALVELALATLVFKKFQILHHDPRLDRWLDYIFRAYSRPAFHEFMFSGHPLALTGHVVLWLACTFSKDPFPVSRSRVQQHLNAHPLNAVARSWHRWIELRYFLDWAGFHHDLPPQEDLFLCSPFEQQQNSGRLSEPQLYELTHMVMYLFDFGSRRPAFFSEAQIEAFVHIIDQAIEQTILSHHWDLLAELLLTRQCLRDDENPVWRDGWGALGGAMYEHGAILEGPDGRLVNFLPGNNVDRQAFLNLYHRTLMTALAFFVRPLENHDVYQRGSI